MSMAFLVTIYEESRVVYRVIADSAEQAAAKWQESGEEIARECYNVDEGLEPVELEAREPKGGQQ